MLIRWRIPGQCRGQHHTGGCSPGSCLHSARPLHMGGCTGLFHIVSSLQHWQVSDATRSGCWDDSGRRVENGNPSGCTTPSPKSLVLMCLSSHLQHHWVFVLQKTNLQALVLQMAPASTLPHHSPRGWAVCVPGSWSEREHQRFYLDTSEIVFKEIKQKLFRIHNWLTDITLN